MADSEVPGGAEAPRPVTDTTDVSAGETGNRAGDDAPATNGGRLVRAATDAESRNGRESRPSASRSREGRKGGASRASADSGGDAGAHRPGGGADSGAAAGAARSGDGAPHQEGAAARADGAPARKPRRRGSRGGRKRNKARATEPGADGGGTGAGAETAGAGTPTGGSARDDTGSPPRAEEGSHAGTGGEPESGRSPARDGGDATARTTDRGGDRAASGGRSGGDGGRSGGRRRRSRGSGGGGSGGSAATSSAGSGASTGPTGSDELPEPSREGRPSVTAAAKALVPKRPPPRKPRIGDTLPAPAPADEDTRGKRPAGQKGGRGKAGDAKGDTAKAPTSGPGRDGGDKSGGDGRRRRRRRKGRGGGERGEPVEALRPEGVELDEAALERRKGRERKGRPVGRYSMSVHVSDKATQIAVLEGRALIEHHVSRPSDDVSQIHGNVYLGRVQNVLPGMEAAFVDIGTPKNAVLYRGDVHYDQEDIERSGQQPRIEQMLKAGQSIVCQVTKNPIGAKGARLTQEVSLPGRFVVLIPNSSTYGISKRLADDERKRLRTILDKVKPAQHGIIVRTAAQNVTSEEIEDDVRLLAKQWQQIEALAKRSKAPTLLYREPDMAVRVIREEFNQDYRNVAIDDPQLFEEVRDYVSSISPELVERVELYDPETEKLPLFERYHVHEQLHRALDRKVWLPSGGSLIIEHTEALTVIDVNTGKNVGRSNLEETVYRNNLEAAVEIARQLRLRDIGGIIVIDFIDMERRDNRDEVVRVFRDALSRDKTRTQVFDISELGLCEMTRKRIGEGLLESFTLPCPECEGRGMQVDQDLLPD